MSERAETLKTLAALAGYGLRLPGSGERQVIIDGRMTRAALVEQIAPLLGARVASGELDCTPDSRATLVSAHLACLAADQWAESTRAPLLSALRARGIPTMLLKGGALVRTVYGQFGLRLMSDLDVLVPSLRWREAHSALASAGGLAAPTEALVLRLRLNHERSWRMRSGAVVDLHRALTAWPLFRVDHDGLFARAHPIGDLLAPAPDDLFVSLALHAAQDGFAMPFRAVVDGLALAASSTLSPDTVASRARAWGAGRATATWLRMLIAYGLPADPWRSLAAALAPGGSASTKASGLPRPVPELLATRSADRWRARWQLLRAHDSPTRPLVFLGYRGALRAVDAARPHFSRR